MCEPKLTSPLPPMLSPNAAPFTYTSLSCPAIRYRVPDKTAVKMVGLVVRRQLVGLAIELETSGGDGGA
jgi:hypothetical protein